MQIINYIQNKQLKYAGLRFRTEAKGDGQLNLDKKLDHENIYFIVNLIW